MYVLSIRKFSRLLAQMMISQSVLLSCCVAKQNPPRILLVYNIKNDIFIMIFKICHLTVHVPSECIADMYILYQ